MKLDQDTRVETLLTAIPSAAGVLRNLGVTLDGNERKTLRQICEAHNIDFEEFLHAMDRVDWDEEKR